MTSKSRTFWTFVALAFIAAVAIVSLSAQEPAGQRRGPGRGFGQGPGPLAMLQQLDLTDAQREQIKALVDARKPDESGMRKIPELQRELNAAIFADTPDTAKIEQLKAAIAEAEAANLNQRIDLQLKIAQILTPEQRQKAREFTPAGPGRGRGGRGPWH